MADRAGRYVGYDEGGVLPPGSEMVVNDSGAPIRVLTYRELQQGLDYTRRTYGGERHDDTPPASA